MKKTIIILVLVVLITAIDLFLKNKEDETTEKIDYPVWIEMMEQPSVNLEEARKSFDEYWKHNTHFKGDNSKQFERWYARNSKRLDEFGNVISAEEVIDEFQKMRAALAFQQNGQWLNYGPINVGPRDGVKKDGGRVKDVAFHPTDVNTLYVSCFKSGLFRTTDGGNTWIPLTDQLPDEVLISKIKTSNPNTIIIGTSLGVKISTDGGTNWNASTGLSGETNALIIKSDNENIVVAGNDLGIFRSIDGGVSFSMLQSAKDVEELRVHPTNPNIMYAGTNGGAQNSNTDFSQFFTSTDGGLTWAENTTDFGNGTFMKIAVTPAQPNYVYVINSRDHLGTDSFDGVYLSTDSGASFTKKSVSPPNIVNYNDDGQINLSSRGQPNYNLFIVADPNNANTLYAGGVKSWKSVDGGINWTQVFNDVTSDGGGLHLDQLTWAYSPIDDKLFAVNDGGIYFLNDNNKFQTITDGLPISEVWECTQSQQNKTNVAGGTFHCGIKLNKDGIWYSPWGGDESTVLYDYSDDNYVYHFKYNNIHRSVDGGLNFSRINSTSADRGEYTGTGVLDKSDVNTLFVGLFEVERINNARTAASGTVWDKISSFGGTTKILKIEQSVADHNVMYVSRGSGSFFRSDDVRATSPSFSDLTSNLIGSGTINDIATHPTNANIVYILRGSHVYKSSNKGVSWIDISSGLPNIPMLEMVYDNTSDEGIYVGTDMGVFYKDANMTSWIDYSNGLPVIRVSGMDIYYGDTRDDSFLTVSTDGRGFWRSALDNVVITAPVANFSAISTNIIAGASITFTDFSTNSPVLYDWTFEGGEPSTSKDVNPNITYNTPGNYSVTLTASNASGSDSKTISGYITVSDNANDLLGHYKFDGDLLDSSGFVKHLSATNYPEIIVYENNNDGNSTSAITTNGPSGYLSNADNFTITGNDARTVTAWIKSDVNAYQGIVSMGSGGSRAKYSVIINTSGQLRTEVSGTGHAGTVDITDGTWHHIASVYDGQGTNVLYVDGLEVATSASFGTLVTTPSPLYVGSEFFDPSNRGFQGALDDVHIYGKALSEQEITTIMNDGTLSVVNQSISRNKLVAYPNAVYDRFTIKAKQAFDRENTSLKVYSANGSLMKIDYQFKNDRSLFLDMSGFSAGLYFVIIKTANEKSTLKIMKK